MHGVAASNNNFYIHLFTNLSLPPAVDKTLPVALLVTSASTESTRSFDSCTGHCQSDPSLMLRSDSFLSLSLTSLDDNVRFSSTNSAPVSDTDDLPPNFSLSLQPSVIATNPKSTPHFSTLSSLSPSRPDDTNDHSSTSQQSSHFCWPLLYTTSLNVPNLYHVSISRSNALQDLMAYTDLPEHPISATLRYVFNITNYVHTYQITHHFSHLIQTSLPISCSICNIYLLAVITRKISTSLTRHWSNFSNSFSCPGCSSHAHYSYYLFSYYSTVRVATLLSEIHHNLCITMLAPAPIGSILFNILASLSFHSHARCIIIMVISSNIYSSSAPSCTARLCVKLDETNVYTWRTDFSKSDE